MTITITPAATDVAAATAAAAEAATADLAAAAAVTGFDLLDGAVDLVLGGAWVDDIAGAMPVWVHDAKALGQLIELMQGYLHQTFSQLHTPDCATVQPATILQGIRSVACAHCIPSADVRRAIRYATKPTAYQRAQFEADPVHWARIIALVVAAVLRHSEDPFAQVDALTATLT